MSELKFPFCQQELDIGGVDGILRGRPKCRNLGTEILWQELIRTQELLEIEDAEHSMCHTQMLKTTEKLERTRKALDKAIWWLNEIVENHRFTPISTAEKALAEITKGRKDDVV